MVVESIGNHIANFGDIELIMILVAIVAVALVVAVKE